MAEEEDIALQLSDLTSSEAYKVVEELLKVGSISVERADNAKAKFARLHGALTEAMQREKQLLEQARIFKRQVDSEKASTSAAGSSSSAAAEGSLSVEALREDVEAAMAEAAMAQEQQQLAQLEVTDLQRQRNELAARMEELAAEHAAALGPLISGLRLEVAQLAADLEEERKRVEQAKSEVAGVSTRMAALQGEIAGQREVITMERAALVKAEPLPEKARRQSEAAAALLRNVQGQLESASRILAEYDRQAREAGTRERELIDEHAKLMAALDRGRLQVDTKERGADDLRKDIELAGVEADRILSEQVELELRGKAVIAEHKLESDALSRRQREKDLLLKAYRTAEISLQEARDLLPNLKFQVEQVQRDLHMVDAKKRTQSKEFEEVKRDLDIAMNSFLNEEAIGKEAVAAFQLSYKEVAHLEMLLGQLRAEEAERGVVLRELASQRDRVALAIANKLAKVKDVQGGARIREVELQELQKSRRQVARRIRDFEKLYDLVKNQRNKFVNLIQAAGQSTTEMRDKLKILQNELGILHSEVHNKGKLLTQSRSQHSSAVAERDQLRVELGRLGAMFRERQAMVDEQVAEVDKLNSIINTAEVAMMRLRRQYEVAIEARNYTGMMLIDRNDELCVLYEKAHIQEEVLKTGELELRRREDEMRLLRLEVQELERSINVTRRLMPTIPLLDNDVARLQKQILETRREAEKLALALESPDNLGRWRLLEGKIPDKEELAAKLQALEERLNDKKEALLEKELILEEVSLLANKLRAQASEGRADTLELAKQVNEFQARLRAVTRKIMAAVSELSMYQATALKLGAERDELAAEVSTAGQRLEQGLPPTADAEREWSRIEREKLTLEDYLATRSAEAEALEARVAEIQSTAEPRPNAYIPEELGIPKPYGSFAPFKPADTGSTMRHIRRPQPKEIVI